LRVALVALPALLFSGLAWLDYGIEIDRARESVTLTTDALAEHAQTVMQTIELVLARVTDHIEGQNWTTLSTSRETHDFLARLKSEFPQLESVFLVNPAGINVASSRIYPMPHYDVREREYFATQAAHDQDGMQISAPFKGAIDGTYAFTVSRRRVLGGQFDGIVAVTVSPQYFEGFYRVILDHPKASAAALVRTDGALLVRFPEYPDQGARLPPGGPLMRAVRPGVDFRLFSSDNRLTGRAQLSGYRRLRELPLLVNFSLDHSVYMANWRLHAAVLALCACLLSLLLLATETMVRRQIVKQHRTLRQLVLETERRRRAEAAAQQSQKMEAVGRLTGGVAHDFNNLLAAILGSLELVLRQEQNPRSIKLLRTAFEAAQRGARLTAQMLSFSRKREVAVQSVDANATIRGMEDLLGRTIGPRVRVHYELADDLWPVLADPVQLELALLNLEVNARDAMPDGGELTFRTVKAVAGNRSSIEAGDGDGVRIEVADTGVGMAEEIRLRALEPFFTTKGPGRGTGLGLSMVYGLVSEVGGTLSIDSAPGRGTTINLFLCRADSAPVAVGSQAVVASVPQPGRILLVDDDASVRLSTRMMLEDIGHTVVDVASGPEALQVLANSRRFDLIVMDFAMPLMDGGQLAAEVKKLWPEAPLLFMTGYVENDGLRPWSALGYRTLQKPFSARELATAIQVATRRAGGDPAEAA
jgi:two-component system NtrC family sensor kinase